LIALAIKLDSRGPVFFSQERVGQNGRRFRMYKFRTMRALAQDEQQSLAEYNEMRGPIFKVANDPRITRVGRVLRRLSLDELPQFWNVLKGEMSLVGTRPPTPQEVEQYELWHYRRISIRPGMTGLYQVSGRGRIRDFDEIVRLDLKYVDEWSLALDVKILLRTLLSFARGQ
jgi:lipopolysaccharide/colanic/teichoic acid biosynthesis glycosyltransferase